MTWISGTYCSLSYLFLLYHCASLSLTHICPPFSTVFWLTSKSCLETTYYKSNQPEFLIILQACAKFSQNFAHVREKWWDTLNMPVYMRDFVVGKAWLVFAQREMMRHLWTWHCVYERLCCWESYYLGWFLPMWEKNDETLVNMALCIWETLLLGKLLLRLVFAHVREKWWDTCEHGTVYMRDFVVGKAIT